MVTARQRLPDEFFSCDWGSSTFRLRKVQTAGCKILEEVRTEDGIRALWLPTKPETPEARHELFSEYLRKAIQPLLGSRIPEPVVLISGMASSTLGWKEVPYANCPFPIDGSASQYEVIGMDLDGGRRAKVVLIAGFRTGKEMLRGEETELIGLLSNPAYEGVARDGLVILPGTHSKHLRIKERSVQSIGTYMTGEFFDVLTTHSLLAASTKPGSERESTASPEFFEGMDDALGTGFAASVFQVRTRNVLGGASQQAGRDYLSGLLIGTELAALRELDPAMRVLLSSPGPAASLYRAVIERLRVETPLTLVTGEEAALATVQGHRVLLERVVSTLQTRPVA